jgi:Domain of unknown function (DUF4387)
VTRLRDLASVVRSKNAGPLLLTLDVMLPDAARYGRVLASSVLEPSAIAALYGVPAATVETIEHASIYTVKVTMRRPVRAGDPDDTDLYGAQMYVPLLDLEVPD